MMDGMLLLHFEAVRKSLQEPQLETEEEPHMANHGIEAGGKVLQSPLKESLDEVGLTSYKELILNQVTIPFLRNLVKIARLLQSDVEAVLKQDVVVTDRSEVLLCYPGVNCLIHQRIASPRSTVVTGIDIHPATQIGKGCFIDHGTGLVVGATAELGDNVTLYHGVTLGAKSFPVDPKTGLRIKHQPRHPILQNGVTVYSHATILGRVTIGEGAVVGGNVWLLQDVSPGEMVLQKPPEIMRKPPKPTSLKEQSDFPLL